MRTTTMNNEKENPKTAITDNRNNPVTKKDYLQLFIIGIFFYFTTYFISWVL